MALVGDRHEVMAGQAGRHCHREPGDRTLHPVIADGARRGAAHDPIVVIENLTLHQPILPLVRVPQCRAPPAGRHRADRSVSSGP